MLNDAEKEIFKSKKIQNSVEICKKGKKFAKFCCSKIIV